MTALPRTIVRCAAALVALWVGASLAAPGQGGEPARESAGAVLHVAKDAGAQHRSIQAAIDAAPAGATIRIGPGVYEESLRIRKALVLEGAGWVRTTIAAPLPESEPAMRKAMEDLVRQHGEARTDEAKKALGERFLDKWARPAAFLFDARDVRFRAIKFTAVNWRNDPRWLPGALVRLHRSKMAMKECAVVGSPRSGVSVADGSEVEIEHCLIAAVWQTGIEIGEPRMAGGRARIADCDVRNCHYAGICIRRQSDAVVERCRISGAAWHGIRYDDCSPTIVGNRIFGNARCGIYASGKTAATVKGNVLARNEMSGMSCWSENRDTIMENTFAGNLREGLAVIGQAQPTVERNVFFGHPTAVVCSASAQEAPEAVGRPRLQRNLFWKNEKALARPARKSEDAKAPWVIEEITLADETASVLADPRFAGVDGGDFALAPDSPARRADVGAVDPPPMKSPWALRPEELAIIPDGETRDSEAWRQPVFGPPPPVVLLYHDDIEIKIRTIDALAATRDRGLVDDLIRAMPFAGHGSVSNAYYRGLRALTGDKTLRNGGAWKAWLAEEAKAGRLKIDYLPLDPGAAPPEQRAKIPPWVTRLGPEHFDRMAAALATPGRTTEERHEAVRYMIVNDHRDDAQKFLGSDWLGRVLAFGDLAPQAIALLEYYFAALADPGPIRQQLRAQVAACLDSQDSTVLVNTLRLLAGATPNCLGFPVPDVGAKVRKLVESPRPQVAAEARRAMARIDPQWAAEHRNYEESLTELYEVLGREYPCFQLKGIDWKAVGKELLPRAKELKSDEEFGLLCMELVARLEDSHAVLGRGSAAPPQPPWPQWDPGFACLIDDRAKPVVYYVDKGGPAERGGVRVGMTLVAIQGKPAEEALAARMKLLRRYGGYSSDRMLRYFAAQTLPRQIERNAIVTLEMQDPDGAAHNLQLPAALGVRYLPRLPVPIPGVSDSANVGWKMLEGQIGYLFVRRIREDLIGQLDRAVGELKGAKGLILDVRGNSGGGFDSQRALRNFDPNDQQEPDRPRFLGPIALVVDARCISAGEGWASWFVARKRAKLFGEATAGASSRKRTMTLKNGLYTVTFPVKAYTGFLDRPIERRGLEPDVAVRQNARDLAKGRDTVLEAARAYLMGQGQGSGR